MYQAGVVLDMPLDGAAVCGFGMPLNTSDFSIYFFVGGSIKSPLSLVIQAEAPSSSMRARESESNCRPGGVSSFAHVVVMAGMVSWRRRARWAFFLLRRRGRALRKQIVWYLRCIFKVVIAFNRGSVLQTIGFCIE